MELLRNIVLVYIEVTILLSCFNLLGVATASPAIRRNDTDQQALLKFKAKITGDQLKVMNSWNSSIHFCRWYGVTCGRKHQRVTKLELQSLKLSGSLTPYIGNLSFLRELNLVGNSFYNQIPQEIGRLRRLEMLYLTNNSISGQIPSNLSACSKLAVVNMRGNQLTGEVPASLSFLSNLKVLSLLNNSLTGSIPPALGNLSSLEKLVLTYNALSGIIPEALGQLTNLSRFMVAANAISGTLPIPMFNLSNIKTFDIAENKIQCTLQPDLAIHMSYLEFFSVMGNRISGQIPISISNASNLKLLQLNDNILNGNVPSLQKLDKLFILQLGTNHLGHGREGDLNFLCTLVNNTKLEFLYIYENNFGGVFPKCISNFSSTLLRFGIGQNKVFGIIPDGIGNLINLEDLFVSENRLSGSIPFDIGRLQKIKRIFADGNFLSGTIPRSIGNLTVLIALTLNANNLQGSIPSSLGKCQKLLLMDLSNNNLNGPIPPQLLGLSSMSRVLDLSANYLTGDLPVEVENLKNLGEFHVSRNRLSGLLPNGLGSCVSLEKLYLDGNLFEGVIPLSLSSLRGLVELDVSNNNLSGGVPECFVSFKSLMYLNLSFNDFEGMIPSEGVFKNASAMFVDGNSKLCGGIPELHLSRCNSKSSNTSLRVKIAIVVVILGVTLTFCIVLVLWFRKKKEQQPTTCPVNSLLQLSYQSVLRATDGFSPQNLIGSGSFSFVYKGILEESGTAIAVKVLNLLNGEASKSFLAECEALKNIRHRNLVKLLTAISGVDHQGNDFKALVYKLMTNGSLEDWLHQSAEMNEPGTSINLNFLQRISVATDVAHALEYVHHHCGTNIIHCDLKPSNILLDEEMVGHLSDFGSAKILSADMLNYSTNQASSLGLRGTVGYAPPEYGMGGELSTKGDVYSYGILLLELFTGKRPTHAMFKEGFSIHNFVRESLPDQMTKILDPILLQETNKHLQHLNAIFEIGLSCCAESPRERMDMSDAVSKLCSIRYGLLHPTLLYAAAQSAGTKVT